MDAYFTSLVRTFVPVAVGTAVSWLATKNIKVDEATKLKVTTVLTGAVIALYYAVVRLLETKWAKFGWLLGKPKAPTYGK